MTQYHRHALQAEEFGTRSSFEALRIFVGEKFGVEIPALYRHV